jgi:hypothetical protein
VSGGDDGATGRAPHLGGHEEDRPPARPLLVAGAAFALLLVVAYVVPTGLEKLLYARRAASSPPANPLVAAAGRQLPPQPRLQVNPERDIAELRRSEDEILNSYGWVDRRAGLVRLPISRAIEVLAKRGSAAPLMDAPPGDAPVPGTAARPEEVR